MQRTTIGIEDEVNEALDAFCKADGLIKARAISAGIVLLLEAPLDLRALAMRGDRESVQHWFSRRAEADRQAPPRREIGEEDMARIVKKSLHEDKPKGAKAPPPKVRGA